MPDYQGVTVLLLGGTGFIGRWVAQLLYRSGAELHALVRDAERARELAHALELTWHTHVCDLSDVDVVTRQIHDLQPDIIFNLAGYGVAHSERDATMAARINTELVPAICDALPRQGSQWRGQRIVHAGSALEYGTAAGDLSEDTAEAPTTLYGETKLRGTRALTAFCRDHAVPGLTARLFTVYGPGERAERLLPTLIRAAATTEPIDLTAGLQQRDFTYVEEVAEGLLKLGASRAEHGAVVNVAAGHLHTVREFVETSAEVLGIEPERLRFGVVPTRVEEMSHLPVSNQLLRALTGWAPSLPIREGVRATLARLTNSPSATA